MDACVFASILGAMEIGASFHKERGIRVNKRPIERRSQMTKSRTDWSRVDALTDETIDYSDIPAPEADFWRDAVKYDPVKFHAPD